MPITLDKKYEPFSCFDLRIDHIDTQDINTLHDTIHVNTDIFNDLSDNDIFNKYIQMILTIVYDNNNSNKDVSLNNYLKTLKKVNPKSLFKIYQISNNINEFKLLEINPTEILKKDIDENVMFKTDINLLKNFMLLRTISDIDVHTILMRKQPTHGIDPYYNLKYIRDDDMYDNYLESTKLILNNLKKNKKYKCIEFVKHISNKIENYSIRDNDYYKSKDCKLIFNNDYNKDLKNLKSYYQDNLGVYYLEDISLGQNILRNDINYLENWLNRSKVIEFYSFEIENNLHYIKYIGYDYLKLLLECSDIDSSTVQSEFIINDIHGTTSNFAKVHATWKKHFESVVCYVGRFNVFTDNLVKYLKKNENKNLFNNLWENYYDINHILIILLISSSY